MSGRSDEDECRIVPPIDGQTLKSMEDASYFSDNMPQIGGRNLQLVEGASNLCDILPRFGGRILTSVEKASNDREINCNQWKK